MKEMNRREFLTLTGAAVVALSLAGCSGGPSAPPAPAAPTGKEAELLAAINKVWKEKFDANQVVHEQLSFNQDAFDFARLYVSPCVNADKAEVEMTPEKKVAFEKEVRERLNALRKKYGSPAALDGSVIGCNYALDYSASLNSMKLLVPYTLSGADFDGVLETMLWDTDISDLGIYCPTVAGKDYIVIARLSDRR